MFKKILTIVIIIILILIIILAISKTAIYFYKTEYSEIVEQYAKEYDVDKYLIYAIIKNESNFDNSAKSHKEAKGLMQIMNATAEELANKLDIEYIDNTLYDEKTNIQLGVYYLKELLNKYDNYLIAVAAYNAGIGNVDSWISKGTIKSDGSDIEKIPFKETNNYVRKISRDYKIYKKIYEKDVN